jgi:hypothetical protein
MQGLLMDDRPSFFVSNSDSQPLRSWATLSVDDVIALINEAPTKSCSLDPIPMTAKERVERTRSCYHSHRQPLPLHSFISFISKTCHCHSTSVLGNYHPVSNLSFLLKLVERAVNFQLMRHLDAHDLLPDRQSAYRKNVSTETALLRLFDDLRVADRRGATALLFLVLSAAFDTIDHRRLLDHLASRCGILDDALAWFASYLSERTQSVRIGSSESPPLAIRYGVP